MEKKGLYEQLYDYGETDYYPYHMPGHKRKQTGNMPEHFLKADITEIDGFDNLHQPEGILKEFQEYANKLYKADKTYFLINGSTCGVLSAISAVLLEGGHLLMARGCHKSAYHAVYLRRLKVTYLFSGLVDGFSFTEAVTAEQVEQALAKEPDIGAVLIVSPTYEGRIADIEAIARVVHERGIPLIVDEAHGAHLGFGEGFAPGSCTQGADLVIHSVHKTLPAMTQTALLHVNGSLVDRDRVERFLHIYQSSSPSYVLMASICDAMRIVDKQGKECFAKSRSLYKNMVENLQECRRLRFIKWNDIEAGRHDIGKLVIAAAGNNFSGQKIYDILRDKYHLQCEMAAGNYCLAMFTIADEREAYDRMTHALLELDSMEHSEYIDCKEYADVLSYRPETVYSIAEAWDMPSGMTRVSDAVNCVSADFVNLYPPGIPIIAPGEVVTEELHRLIGIYLAQGLRIQGIVKQGSEYFLRTL